MTWRREPSRSDRLIGWLMALSGIVLIAAEAPRIIAQHDAYTPLWSAIGALTLCAVVALAALGRVLPTTALVPLWAAIPVATLGLQLMTFRAYHGQHLNDLVPWIWRFETLSSGLVVLILPPAAALAYPLVSALTPALSAVVFLGDVPATIAAETPIHMGNVAITVIFLGMRKRLNTLRRAEDRARSAEISQAVQEAHTERQAQLARLVHDEVLSVLTAALQTRGEVTPAIERDARRALEVLRDAPAPHVSEPTDSRRIAARLTEVARSVLPRVSLSLTRSGDAAPPEEAVEALALSFAEALRNADRHAHDATVSAAVSIGEDGIRIAVADGGPGFDVHSVPEHRMGVRGSIVERMRALPGGAARIHSGPFGTRVELSWQR